MRLSLRSLLFGAVVALLAVVSFWGAEPLGLWRYALLCFAVALLFEWWQVQNAELNLELEPKGVARLGLPVEIGVRLHGEQALTTRHRLIGNGAVRAPSEDGALVLTRGAHTQAGYVATGLATRLGRTAFPEQWLEIDGAFGLGHWLRRVPVDAELRVAPARLSDRVGTPGSVELGLRSRPRVGQGSEVFALRDQRPDDPATRIDWKATARRGRPVIRETETEEQLELLLVLDAGLGAGVVQGPLTRFGHAANVAARLAEFAELQGDRCGLLVYADRVLARVPVGRGRRQVERIRGALGEADARPHESNPLGAMLDVRSMVRHRALVVVFADLDDADSAGQLVEATRLLRPVHLPLVAALRDEESEAIARARPAGWRDPWFALASEELDRVAETTRLRLRRLGAQVVYTHANELDGALRRRYARLRRERKV